MASNFDFLKTVDKKLFDLIETAEQLYRDEYFDQCIVQTRKIAENIDKMSFIVVTDAENIMGKGFR